MACFGILRSGISICKGARIRSSGWLIADGNKSNFRSYFSLGTYSAVLKSVNYRFCKPCSVINPTNHVTQEILHNNCLACLKPFSTTLIAYKKKKSTKKKNPYIDIIEEDIDDRFLDDPAFESLRSDSKILGFIGTQSAAIREIGVIVLQPWVKWGPNMKVNTSGQLMLDEAVALISTLPGVCVVAKEVVPVRSIEGKTIFGSGTLDRLVSQARSTRKASCVFISVNMMKKSQMIELEQAFGMKILDRYSAVLGIFRNHARTKEAKLQVALAELPYIRKRVSGEAQHAVVVEREKRLKSALNKLAGIRALIRRSREKSNLPTVAVVGYTNAGKTTLIHALTGDKRAEGKDQLFATLDVTAHGARLPCGVEVAFIDTIGFIQDIPTELLASFKATLEDAVYADVIVHIRDASHPDYKLQGAIVSQTLSSLPLPENTPIITVANKIDLGMVYSKDLLEDENLVSAVTGQGLEELLESVEAKVLSVTGRRSWKFSLPTGSDQIQWLRKATGLTHEEIDPDNPQITHVIAVLTDEELAVYERNFRS